MSMFCGAAVAEEVEQVGRSLVQIQLRVEVSLSKTLNPGASPESCKQPPPSVYERAA